MKHEPLLPGMASQCPGKSNCIHDLALWSHDHRCKHVEPFKHACMLTTWMHVLPRVLALTLPPGWFKTWHAMLHSKSQVSSSASLVQGASLLKTAAGNTEKTAQLLERLKVLVGGAMCVCVCLCVMKTSSMHGFDMKAACHQNMHACMGPWSKHMIFCHHVEPNPTQACPLLCHAYSSVLQPVPNVPLWF